MAPPPSVPLPRSAPGAGDGQVGEAMGRLRFTGPPRSGRGGVPPGARGAGAPPPSPAGGPPRVPRGGMGLARLPPVVGPRPGDPAGGLPAPRRRLPLRDGEGGRPAPRRAPLPRPGGVGLRRGGPRSRLPGAKRGPHGEGPPVGPPPLPGHHPVGGVPELRGRPGRHPGERGRRRRLPRGEAGLLPRDGVREPAQVSGVAGRDGRGLRHGVRRRPRLLHRDAPHARVRGPRLHRGAGNSHLPRHPGRHVGFPRGPPRHGRDRAAGRLGNGDSRPGPLSRARLLLGVDARGPSERSE